MSSHTDAESMACSPSGLALVECHGALGRPSGRRNLKGNRVHGRIGPYARVDTFCE